MEIEEESYEGTEINFIFRPAIKFNFKKDNLSNCGYSLDISYPKQRDKLPKSRYNALKRLYVIWNTESRRSVYIGTTTNFEARILKDRIHPLWTMGYLDSIQNLRVHEVQITSKNSFYTPDNYGHIKLSKNNGNKDLDVENLLICLYIEANYLVRNQDKRKLKQNASDIKITLAPHNNYKLGKVLPCKGAKYLSKGNRLELENDGPKSNRKLFAYASLKKSDNTNHSKSHFNR